jgi:hypothetical protein
VKPEQLYACVLHRTNFHVSVLTSGYAVISLSHSQKPLSFLELPNQYWGATQTSVQWVTKVISAGVKGPKREVAL